MHSYTYTLQCVALTTSTQGNVALFAGNPVPTSCFAGRQMLFYKTYTVLYSSRTLSAVHPRDISPQVAR